MKRLTLWATLAITAMLFTSCGKEDYKSFIGTWGVEKIEYYNTDYAGNPIGASLESHVFDPNDTDNGIHLIFREDKTGEMRDSAVDTVWFENTAGETDYVVNPEDVKKAYLKRVSDTPTKSARRQAVNHPRKPGSFLGGR